jgi:hypothetical protein
MVAVEQIPNEDAIYRLIYFSRMYSDVRGLIWEVIFEFPGGEPESVVWSKYARSPDDVHCIGCEVEVKLRERRPDTRYEGFLPSTAGKVRGIKTRRGHGFSVGHKPEEGIHHAEISYAAASGVRLAPNDKSELKLALKNVFGALAPHSCA